MSDVVRTYTDEPEELIPVPDRILGARDGMSAGKRIKLYDFRRPDKFSREQLRTMQMIAEGFARLAATRLSAALRLPCDLKLDLVDQLTYEEFMTPLPSPATLAVVAMDPLKGQTILHIDAAGTDAILERLFGATPVTTEHPLASGSITDIEVSQLERMLAAVIEDFGSTWSFVDGMKPRLTQIETEARFCQIVPPQEMIVLTSFTLNVGAVQAKLDIVYPFLVLEPVIGMLSAKYWYERRESPLETPSIEAARRAPMPAELLCDAGSLSIDALRSLHKGSVIPVPEYDEGRAWLRLGGARVVELTDIHRDGDSLTAAVDGGGALVQSRSDIAADPMARLADELRGGLAAIKDSVSAAMNAMASRIDELKGGQEDLSDRVLFGQADAAGARPAAKPFASLAGIQPEAFALFLASERPQLCALVLSYLDDAAGARLLSLLPETVQPGITKRIATMGGVAPEVMADVERILGKNLSVIDRTGPAAGGIQKVVGILNFSPRDTERLVITALDQSDPELAESIKRNMFVFEDIIILDDESIAAVLEQSDEQDIVVAMKPLAAQERERLLGRFPADRRERIGKTLAALGRVRLAECDAAGFRVVELIRALEKEGRIGILRQGE